MDKKKFLHYTVIFWSGWKNIDFCGDEGKKLRCFFCALKKFFTAERGRFFLRKNSFGDKI